MTFCDGDILTFYRLRASFYRYCEFHHA